IIVNPRPTIQPISDVICSEGTFSITPSATLTNNIIPANTTYTWTFQDNPNVTGEQSQTNPSLSVISGTLTNRTNIVQQVLYSVTPISGALGNCPGQPFTLTINVDPKPKILDTTLTICSGTSFNYTPLHTPPSMLVPAGTIYSWSAPVVTGGLIGGVAGTGTGNITGSLSNPTSAVQTATYTVTPKSGNCTGPDFKVTVRVNPAPGVIFAPNNQKICSGDNTLAVTLTSSSSGVSIPWQATQPAGITGIIANGFDNIPVQTLINNTPNPITITYTATAQTTGSATCSGAPGTYTIVVNPRPKIANITQAICSDSFFTVTPSVNVSGNIIPAGTTYTWPVPTVSTAGTITGTRAGNAQSLITDTLKNLTNQVQTVTYTVTPTSGIADSCKGNPFTITVTVYPTPVIPTQYDTICTGETFLLNPQNGNPNANVIVPNGTRYSWSAPSAPPGIGGVVSGANQPTITGVLTNTTFVPETIEYTVTPTSGIAGACQGKPFKVFVTVNPLSSISNNPRSQAVCTENTTNAVNWTSFTPNSSFAWTLVSSGSIIGFVPSGSGPTLSAMTLKNVGVDVDSLVYSVTSTASACAAPATLYKIYVYPDAEAKFDAPIDTACWPFNIPIRNTSPATANGDYKWYANGNLIGSGTNFPGYTIQGPDDNITIKMVAISKYGCRADSISKSFYTYKQPDASFTSSIDKACGPLSVYFTNTSTFNSTFKYEWDFGNGRTSTRYQPDSIYYVTNPNFGDTVYTVTLKAFNQCDTLRFTKQIIVQSKPLSRFLPNKTTGCSPLTVVYNNSSLGVGNTYIWDFGDGSPTVTTSVKDSMTHTYFVGIKTTFIVKLIAINACGSDTSKFNLVVTPNPIKLDFAVLGTEQNGCAPLTVRFFNKTSGADIFKWDFGTGDILSTTKNIDTVTYTFQNPGRYTVKLQATSICSDTSSTEIIDVFDKAVPKFTPSTLTRCIGDSIKFTNQTTGGATGYLWKFGDGNTSTLVSPGHKYAQSGTYTVTLIAFKNQPTGVTCVDSVKIRVSIIDTLPIDFGISSTLGKCRPFKVTFTNTFLNYKSIEWDFGDGTKKGIGDVVEHIYTQNGTYNVRLTIVAEGGCTYTAVKQITVAAPDGTIRVQTGFNCQDDNIRFEAIPVNTDAIFWSFGDGKTLTTPNRVVFHKYLNPGTYFASAEFLTNEGCRYTVPGTYEIKIDRIVPGFKYVQAEECGSTKVRFIDTSNVFFGKSSIEWNFGDGTKGSGAEITHSYTATGTYVVQQIIKGNSGCSDTIQSSVQVIVRSVPNAEITNDPVICTNTDVRFGSVVTSTDPVNFYKWNFSNGTNSDKDALIVRFANAGNITVQFIAGTIYGCYDTTRKTLKINQTPTVRAAPDATICKGQSVNLIASGALNYTWSPTDYLSNPNIANPVSKPDVTTPYTVKGLSAEGCSAYDTINITVIQPFKISVMPGDSICIGQSIRLLASGAYRYEWSPAATLNQSNIPNPLATPVATTNYRVVGFDEYGCFNDTGYVLVGVGLYPVVNLGPDLTLSTGTLQKLTSTITNGPIEQWLWTPPINLNCSTCPEPTALIKNDIEYKLKVTNFFGCSGEDVMRIKVFCEETQVYIPNAFSPDGDGRNDVFMVRGKGIMQVKSMRIFNRWGDLVFEKTNITPNDPAGGWDGRVRGANIGPDVFAYIVEVVCDNGVPYFYKGNVTLLK
ncbi:MAG: PKD domain-containing protein, partial [Bacteroidota bacterium]